MQIMLPHKRCLYSHNNKKTNYNGFQEFKNDTVYFGSNNKTSMKIDDIFDKLLNDEKTDNETFYNELIEAVCQNLNDDKLRKLAKEEFFMSEQPQDGTTPLHKIIDAKIKRTPVIEMVLQDPDLQNPETRDKILFSTKKIFLSPQKSINANILEYAVFSFNSSAFAKILLNCSFEEKKKLLMEAPFMDPKKAKNLTEFLKTLYKGASTIKGQKQYTDREKLEILRFWHSVSTEPFILMKKIQDEEPSEQLFTEVALFCDKDCNNLLQSSIIHKDENIMKLIEFLSKEPDKSTLKDMFCHKNSDRKTIKTMLDDVQYKSLLKLCKLTEADLKHKINGSYLEPGDDFFDNY